MDMVITILGYASILYLVYWAYELFNSRGTVRMSAADRDRLKHEGRMIKRRQNKGYHV